MRPARTFVATRIAAASAEIRNLVALRGASDNAEVGFPSITLSEVTGGEDPTAALFGHQ